MSTLTFFAESAREGVRKIVARERLATARGFLDDVRSAIDAGLAYDADPTYWASDDPTKGRTVALTVTGVELAVAQGWVCQCKGCRALTTQGVCRNCLASARTYGVLGGCCAGCWLRRHPEVVAERRFKQDVTWLPANVKPIPMTQASMLRLVESLRESGWETRGEESRAGGGIG